MPPKRSAAFAALIALLPISAQAETLTLTPSKDNTLYESTQGSLSNGAGNHLFAGTTGQPLKQRALLAFDIAGSLPAGATVTAATLSLSMSRTIAQSQTVALHRVLADWGEAGSNAGGNEGGGATAQNGDATWIHAFSAATLWATPGGDFAADPSAQLSVGDNGRYSWIGPGLTADVQAWLDGAQDNFGWILIGNEAAQRSSKRFDSRENSANAPTLTIEFDPPATNAPPTVANPVADQSLRAGGPPWSLDIEAAAVFTDADGDALTYTAGTSNSSVLGIDLSDGILTVTPLAAGDATVSLGAADPDGAQATDIVTVRVTENAPPQTTAPSPLNLTAGEAPAAIDLTTVFSDADGDALTYTATSSATAVATAAIDGDDLLIGPVSGGDAVISVTATDPFGATATTTVAVGVADAPAPAGTNDGFSVAVAPSSARLKPGDTLDLVVSAADAVSAKGTLVTVQYDGALLNFVAFTPGDLIPGLLTLPDTPVVGDNGLTTVRGGGTQLGGTPGDGDGVLGTLQFEVIEVLPAEGSFVSVTEVQITASADDRSILQFAAGALGTALVAGGKTGDFDGSDGVDFNDFFLFADQFGSSEADANWDPAFDLAPNGAIDFDDFFVFADNFGS